MFPAVHTAPANFTFGGEALAVILGDLGGFLEGLGDDLGVALGIFGPVGDTGRGVDADDAVRTHAEVAEAGADGAGFADLGEKRGAFHFAAHGGTATRHAPNWSDDGTGDEFVFFELTGEGFDVLDLAVDGSVRIAHEEIDAIEFNAIDLGLGGHREHLVETEKRVTTRVAFTDDTGPHCVMKFGEVVFRHDG